MIRAVRVPGGHPYGTRAKMCSFTSESLCNKLILSQLNYLAITDFGSMYKMSDFENFSG